MFSIKTVRFAVPVLALLLSPLLANASEPGDAPEKVAGGSAEINAEFNPDPGASSQSKDLEEQPAAAGRLKVAVGQPGQPGQEDAAR